MGGASVKQVIIWGVLCVAIVVVILLFRQPWRVGGGMADHGPGGATIAGARTEPAKAAAPGKGLARADRARAPVAANATPRMPVPRLPSQTDDEPAVKETASSWLRRLEGGTNKVVAAQLADYLNAHNRDAASLLAAARVTGERDFLLEALMKYPDDPHVLLDWLVMGAKTPAERQESVAAFCRAAPDNALGDYLAAWEAFGRGAGEDAVRAMMQAYGKPVMDDYTLATLGNCQAAYRAAGYSEVMAAAASFNCTAITPVGYMGTLSRYLLDLQAEYARAGDAASAQATAAMGVLMGERIQDGMGNTVVGVLSGMAIERRSLERVDPDAVLDTTGDTVAMRLKELDKCQAGIRDYMLNHDPAMLGDEEFVAFFERLKKCGELGALGGLKR